MIRAAAVALGLLALLPATASAHATLERTTPERGARLDAAPERVTLHFSEPVEAEFGAVRVFDSHGREVQSGKTFHPGDRGPDVAVALETACARTATRSPTASSRPTRTRCRAGSCSWSATPRRRPRRSTSCSGTIAPGR